MPPPRCAQPTQNVASAEGSEPGAQYPHTSIDWLGGGAGCDAPWVCSVALTPEYCRCNAAASRYFPKAQRVQLVELASGLLPAAQCAQITPCSLRCPAAQATHRVRSSAGPGARPGLHCSHCPPSPARPARHGRQRSGSAESSCCCSWPSSHSVQTPSTPARPSGQRRHTVAAAFGPWPLAQRAQTPFSPAYPVMQRSHRVWPGRGE